MLSLNDARNICRTCLSTDGDFIPLFSHVSKKSRLATKIMNISNVTINEQDGLPNMICKKCIFLIESFDCFQKQIQSVNDKMTKILNGSLNKLITSCLQTTEKFNHLVEENEDSESDYEIQYISDEVKKRVENALKKKRKIHIRNKLALLHPDCTSLSTYHNALLYTLSDLGSREKNKVQDHRSVMSELKDERSGNNDIDVEKECDKQNALNSVEVENRQGEESDDDIEPETLQSANSDCNGRLVIVVEDFDDSEGRIQDLDCMESEEVSVHEKVANSMTENAQNIEPRNFESFARDSEKENEIPENANNVEQQSLELLNRNSANENGIAEHANAETMVENIGQFQHFCYRDKTKMLPFQTNFDNGIENSVPEMYASTDANNPEQCNIDSAGDREANFQSGNFGNSKENISNKGFYYGNKEDDMMVDNPLSIQEEVVETSKSEIPEETYVEMKNFDKSFHVNNFHHETLNYENVEDNLGTSGIEAMEKDPLQLSNDSEETEQAGKLEIVEKPFQSDEQLLGVARSDEGEKENATAVKTHENLPSKKNLKIVPPNKTKTVDVIVISSDSSDEERRKNYKESGKQSISRSARRARKKISQPPPSAVRKIIRVTRCPDQKTCKEDGKNEAAVEANKKFQPRKYFHCTSCNINLYSVSAVLHHHNQIHTPPEELLHCQMCDVQFATKTILHAHFDHHHETHLFRCSFCACEFVLRRNLRAHMNGHLRPKVEEPENKRLKIDEPCEKVQLPVQQQSTNPTNDNTSPAIQKTETDQKTLHQEEEG